MIAETEVEQIIITYVLIYGNLIGMHFYRSKSNITHVYKLKVQSLNVRVLFQNICILVFDTKVCQEAS